MSHRKTLLLAALAALAVPASASAATATVSATAKTASFTGTITEPTGMFEIGADFNGGTQFHGQDLCVQPACDEHTLTVGPDGAQLKLDADGGDAYSFDIELTDPSGTVTTLGDPAADTPPTSFHETLDATPGNWTVRVYGTPNLDSFDYNVGFTFRTPADVANDPPTPASDGE